MDVKAARRLTLAKIKDSWPHVVRQIRKNSPFSEPLADGEWEERIEQAKRTRENAIEEIKRRGKRPPKIGECEKVPTLEELVGKRPEFTITKDTVEVSLGEPIELAASSLLAPAFEAIYKVVFYVGNNPMPPGINQPLLTEISIRIEKDLPVIEQNDLMMRSIELAALLDFEKYDIRRDGKVPVLIVFDQRTMSYSTIIFWLFGQQAVYPSVPFPRIGLRDHPDSYDHIHYDLRFDGKNPSEEIGSGVYLTYLPSGIDLNILFRNNSANPMHILYLYMDLDLLAEDLRAGRKPNAEQIRRFVEATLGNEVIGVKVTGKDKETAPKIILEPLVHA